MTFKTWAYIIATGLILITLSFFAGKCSVPKVVQPKPDSINVVQGLPDTTVSHWTADVEIRDIPAIREGNVFTGKVKRKVALKDNLGIVRDSITINATIIHDLDRSAFDLFLEDLTIPIYEVVRVDTLFKYFDMKTVDTPTEPFLNFEKGVYAGMIIAVAVITAIAYGVYKIMTVWK